MPPLYCGLYDNPRPHVTKARPQYARPGVETWDSTTSAVIRLSDLCIFEFQDALRSIRKYIIHLNAVFVKYLKLKEKRNQFLNILKKQIQYLFQHKFSSKMILIICISGIKRKNIICLNSKYWTLNNVRKEIYLSFFFPD